MPDLTLNEMEISAIGEVANISLGNAATAMGILMHNDIDISIPYVAEKSKGDIVKNGTDDYVITRVDYVKGIQGYSILFLKGEDARIITDLMMGSDGYGMCYQMELGEIHLSAVSECMNQMMGSAATAMGSMLDRLVDISTPTTKHMQAGEYVAYEFPDHDRFVEITFDVKIGDIIVTQIVQIYPFILAKAIADLFLLKKEQGEV